MQIRIPHWCRFVPLVGMLLLAACSSSTTAIAPTSTPTVAPTATSSPIPTATLGPVHYTTVVVTHGVGQPDDLALDSQNRIVFSDFGNNAVNRVEPNGHLTTLIGGFPEPEGIIILPDNSMILAVQGKDGEHKDMIEHVAAGSTTATIIHTFTNNTNLPGVDSISLDPATGDILVPDSPNGIVYRMAQDGTNLRQIAKGFVRPTDALAGPNGVVYVCDEYGNAVSRVNADGSVTPLAHLSDPDDLAYDIDGTLLITTLGDNTVVRLNLATGKVSAPLASNLFEPQGLAVDQHGNIYISEQRQNIIIELQRS